MMTELQFLNRFQRHPNGAWACTKPIKVNGPRGPVMIDEGTSFCPGALFMGLDLAKGTRSDGCEASLACYATCLDHEHLRNR